MPRVGVHMIVKNEAHVIERCLTSLRPLVDWWVVCDTGSTDGTQDAVRRAMDGVPGRLLERPWVDFGHNRQEALEAARDLPESASDDYVLWIDADDQLTHLPDELPELTHDGYHLPVDYGATRFSRVTLTRLGAPWRWRGSVHEYLDLPTATLGHLAAPRVLVAGGGARSTDPDRFRKDASLLEAELARTPDDPRAQFYLAQSWRDAGELERAIAAYRTRVGNPAGWDQERFYAALQLARLLRVADRPADEVSAAFLDAHHLDPSRAEPLVDLAHHERMRERFAIAAIYARAALRLPTPPDSALFVEPDSYGVRAWDELAVACYWSGAYDEGRGAAERALALRPDDERLRANLGFFEGRTG